MIHYLLCMLLLPILMTSQVIFDFNHEADIKKWIIVDDVVMGGRSSGDFILNGEGHGVFHGNVSLENNGGFSSVRYRSGKLPINNKTKFLIRLKGDGKAYQLRIKSETSDYKSYIMPFNTSGKWQEIEINLADMYPSFRGRRLSEPNFTGKYLEEISFLIANNKNEDFRLIIDVIKLR